MNVTEAKLAAARGQAAIPPEALLELVVALTSDADDLVRTEARRTLEAWPADTLIPVLKRRATTPDVLEYFLKSENLRRELLPPVLANRNTPQEAVAEMAAIADLDTVRVLLDNIDLLRTQALVSLKNNSSYLKMHANRLEAIEEGFLFEPSFLELLIAEAQLEDESRGAVGLTEEEAAELDKEIEKAERTGDEEKKHQSLYAKIARMTVSQKVQLAMKGNKEERGLLIRESSKVIARAVLSSPKLTEAEVETFAAMKNVSDEVLRLISMNRKFMKTYSVLRNLANNPRTPIDVGLGLLNRLLPGDLKGLVGNKNVSDVIRKMAEKMVKQKAAKN